MPTGAGGSSICTARCCPTCPRAAANALKCVLAMASVCFRWKADINCSRVWTCSAVAVAQTVQGGRCSIAAQYCSVRVLRFADRPAGRRSVRGPQHQQLGLQLPPVEMSHRATRNRRRFIWLSWRDEGFLGHGAVRRCCRRRDERDHAVRQSPFDVLGRAAALRQQTTASSSGGRQVVRAKLQAKGIDLSRVELFFHPQPYRRPSRPWTLLPPDRKGRGWRLPTIASTFIPTHAPKPWIA